MPEEATTASARQVELGQAADRARSDEAAWAVVGSMLITQVRVLQDLFQTTPADRLSAGAGPAVRLVSRE